MLKSIKGMKRWLIGAMLTVVILGGGLLTPAGATDVIINIDSSTPTTYKLNGAVLLSTDATGAITAITMTVSSGGVTPPTTYTVSASAGSNGTISPSSRTVNSGSQTTFTVTPNSGYTATMGGTCGGSPSSGSSVFTYTTNAVYSNCSVTASFSTSPTPPPGGNITINPIPYGTSANPVTKGTYWIKPGETQYFYVDIPAGQISSRAGMAVLTQLTGLQMLIAQGNLLDSNGNVTGTSVITDTAAVQYFADAVRSGLSPYYLIYPPKVVAKVNGSTSGQSFIMKQSTTETATTTKRLPGRYYIVLKNTHASSSQQYSVYWDQY